MECALVHAREVFIGPMGAPKRPKRIEISDRNGTIVSQEEGALGRSHLDAPTHPKRMQGGV